MCYNVHTGKSISESTKGENCMYLTVKQQVKHLSKEDYLSIKELCHFAKNLTNEAIYRLPLNIMRKSSVVDMNILYSRGEVDTQ